MSVHLRDWFVSRFAPKNGRSGRQDSGPPSTTAARATRSTALAAAGTGLVCLMAYSAGIPSDSISADIVMRQPSGDASGADAPTATETPFGSEPPGPIERLRRLQLNDAVGFLAGDGLGTLTGEFIARVVPVGTPAWRLHHSAALLGGLTASLLVVAMLQLGVARPAAILSALALAFSDPIWRGAVTVDPGMIREPMLALALCFLTLRTDRHKSPWPWVVASALWGVSAIAEPMLLCVLPGIAVFMYLVKRGRPTCGHVPVVVGATGALLLSGLLAVTGVGLRTWNSAANAVALGTLVTEIGLLGLAFLAVAAVDLCGRPTREGLLAVVGWLGVMAWIFTAETVDGRQLSAALVLTCPVVGFGMTAVLRSAPERNRTMAVRVLCLVLPASHYAGNVESIETLLGDRAHWMAHARALAVALPENAAVVTTANENEPIASLWRFDSGGGRPIVEVPLDVRRVRELHEELPIFVFEPTRTYLELLGFRFSNLGRVRADEALETYFERLAPGTLVVAVAGEPMPASLLRAFGPIGGGEVAGPRPVFYAVVGSVGGAAVEETDPREVTLRRTEAGSGPSSPSFAVAIESSARGARVDIDGETVVEEAAGLTVLVLRPDGRPRRILRAVERDGDLRVPMSLRRQRVSRLDEWEACTAVGVHGWADVSRIVANGRIGIHFGSHDRNAALALYLTADDALPIIGQVESPRLRSRIEHDGFDRRDPQDAASLGGSLAADDVIGRRLPTGERYVQRLRASRYSELQPLAALRITGYPRSAIARLLEVDEGQPALVCPAPS